MAFVHELPGFTEDLAGRDDPCAHHPTHAKGHCVDEASCDGDFPAGWRCTARCAPQRCSTTDYAIFLLGRYHEARRRGAEHIEALRVSFREVAPVIVASALTVALALSCLTFARVGLLRSIGIPCAVGILVGMLASLTLLPALICLAGSHGLAQPRTRELLIRCRWRRVGVVVARWPKPILAASVLVLAICALPVAGLRLTFDELAAQPGSTPASRGYQAVNRHFPPNRLSPEIVSIEGDHDLRNRPDSSRSSGSPGN